MYTCVYMQISLNIIDILCLHIFFWIRSIGVLQKTNVIYKFKCLLGDCISDNNNIYVGLTSTTLSRRLTMHLSDTSSIAQHLKKKIHAQQYNYGKFSPTTQY